MKNCRYIAVLSVLMLMSVVITNCGNTSKSDADIDTVKTEKRVSKGTATPQEVNPLPEPDVLAAYDVDRAKALCDKYSSGLLSEENYLEIMDLTEVAFSRLWAMMNAALDECASPQEFERIAVQKEKEWQISYQYADFLANIVKEATADQLGTKGAERMKALNAKMQAEYDSLSARRKTKYKKQ